MNTFLIILTGVAITIVIILGIIDLVKKENNN
jgi:hypothetical protein